MNPPFPPSRQAGQPSLHELMTRFLAAKGTVTDAVVGTEVEPYEVIGGFHAPTKTTWDESTAAFRLFGVATEQIPCPPEWAAFAALDGRRSVVPLAAGFFPQAVRDVSRLTLTSPLPTVPPADGFPGLRSWVTTALRSQSPAALLLAAGVAANLGDIAEADAALIAAKNICTEQWQPILEVQKSAVLAARGSFADAVSVLAASGGHPVTVFNRGLLSLVLGQADEGIRSLKRATVAIPDNSGWRHLALLYCSVAKSYSAS